MQHTKSAIPMTRITFVVSAITLTCIILHVQGVNLNPSEHELVSTQMCPDPVSRGWAREIAHRKESIEGIKLDKPWRSYERFLPCTFQGEDDNTIQIRSINLNVEPWNFTSAKQCSTFIKFQDIGEYGPEFQVFCGRMKFDQYLGPYGHPMVLYYRWERRGLSFPLFHANYGPEDENHVQAFATQYVQIYFSILTNNTWECRVQQYKLDWFERGCTATPFENDDQEPICGQYSCDHLDELYMKKMNIFKQGPGENKVLIWKSRGETFRMRNVVRQKVVPVLFLTILILAYKSYMRAGLRFRTNTSLSPLETIEIRERRIQRRTRRISNRRRAQERTNNSGGEQTYSLSEDEFPCADSACAHSARSHKHYAPHRDLPPSYESLSPPAYSEVIQA